jgi:hypothetical protein
VEALPKRHHVDASRGVGWLPVGYVNGLYHGRNHKPVRARGANSHRGAKTLIAACDRRVRHHVQVVVEGDSMSEVSYCSSGSWKFSSNLSEFLTKAIVCSQLFY